MTTITTATKQILDSSGQPAEGRILFRQSARFVTDDALVTGTPGTVTVKRGRIEVPGTFVLPPTEDGEGVQIVEQFTNRGEETTPVTYWVTVPDESSVEYADLPQITSPTAGPGVPSWAATLLAAISDLDTVNDPVVAGLVEDSESQTAAALYATIESKLPAVNVLDYGVVGDGTTDDTAAFNAAITEARDTKRTLYVPPVPLLVKLTSTVDARYLDVQFEGGIDIAHNDGPGIILGDTSAAESRRNISWSRIRNNLSSVVNPWDEGRNPSVRLVGLRQAQVIMGNADYVQLYADASTAADASLAYCTFYSTGAMINSLEFLGENGTAWINDNKFFGGRLRDIRFGGSYDHNGNKFYGPTIEHANIYFEDGARLNQFLQVRAEGADCEVTFGEGTYGNIIESAYMTSEVNTGANISVIDLGGMMNFVVSSTRARLDTTELFRLDKHSRIFNEAKPYPASWTPIPGLKKLKVRNAGVLLDTGILPIEQTTPPQDSGCTLASRLSSFRVGGPDALWRVRLWVYDEDMQPLDPSEKWYISAVGSWAAHGDGNYQTNTPRSFTYIEITDPAVKFIRFNIWTNVTTPAFDWLSVTALTYQQYSDAMVNLWRRALTRPLFQASAPTEGAAYPGERVGEHMCTARADTTLSAGADASDTSVTVASATGIESGDVIGIELTDETTHWTTVSGAPAGTTVTLTDGLSGAASSGGLVVTNHWA